MINDSVDSLHRQSDIETNNGSSVEAEEQARKNWHTEFIGDHLRKLVVEIYENGRLYEEMTSDVK